MATLIRPNGETQPLQPKKGKTFSLDELYEAIGCQMVQISDAQTRGEIIVFDEEFFCRGDIAKHPTLGICLVGENGELKPWLNRKATDKMHQRMGPYTHNVICGNAVLCKSAELR